MTEPIEERIARLAAGLAPQERAVSEVVLDHLSELAVYNASELAAMAGVSKATVSRFTRSLGFADWAAVREHVRSRRAAGTPIGAAGAPALSAAGAGAILEAERANLAALLAALGDGVLERLARSIVDARTVTVAGFRNGYPVAAHLRAQLAQARAGVRLVPQPGQSIGEELVGLGPGDLVLVAAFRRRPPQLGAVLAAVAASGAGLVVVADPDARALVPAGAEFVPCPVAAPGAFDSYAAAMSFVALLAGAVLGAELRPGRSRVAAIDRAYRALAEIE